MSIMDIVRARLAPSVLTPRTTVVGSWRDWWEEITSDIHESSPAKLFRTQPHLYTVVTFLARNIAQLGLHSFERVDETDRKRDRTSPLARALAGVDGTMTTYELVFATVGDISLYDRAFWFVAQSADLPSGWMVRRIPPTWITPGDRPDDVTPFEVRTWQVSFGKDVVRIPAAQILAFTGYSPTNPLRGSPAVEALRGTLQEQVEAALYRKQVWKRGGRVSAVLQRPASAASWTRDQADRFREDWYANWTGRGPRAGGTPILEDGMTLNRVDFNAREQQFVEAANLSLVTVASAFHINPTMIGQNDGANYSNVREFRKMLYGDTLGPLLAQIEQRINSFLLPMLGVDSDRFYVEFNIAEKLQGSFEEQAAAFASSVGGPYMTRAEARAKSNLPAIPGADELIVPLNVIVGGQASPRDSGSQNRNATPVMQLKAGVTDSQRERIAQVLSAFFTRQGKSVLSAVGAGGDWWDSDRWDSELADDLSRAMHTVASIIGPVEASKLGETDGYDPAMTVNFLKAVAERYARNINITTRDQIDGQLDADEPDPAHVFAEAAGSRADGISQGVGTFVAGFATAEAARQIARRAGRTASKTWVTGVNPRPAHAALNGQTVGIDDKFTNGADYPCDSGNPADSGCNCSLVVSVE